jgi:WD40 repeat protein
VTHDWGQIHDGGVHIISVSENLEFIFTASWDGHLKQFCFADKSLKCNYGKIGSGFINFLILSRDC